MTTANRHVWRKSSFCMNDSNCVELARISTDGLGVRDTKRGPTGPVLQLSRGDLKTLMATIKRGELDL